MKHRTSNFQQSDLHSFLPHSLMRCTHTHAQSLKHSTDYIVKVEGQAADHVYRYTTLSFSVRHQRRRRGSSNCHRLFLF